MLKELNLDISDKINFADSKNMHYVPAKDKMKAVCMSGEDCEWLFWLHPDGQWVSERKLAEWEVMQIEDGILEGDYPEITYNKIQPL